MNLRISPALSPSLRFEGVSRSKIDSGGWKLKFDFKRGATTKSAVVLALAAKDVTKLPSSFLKMRVLRTLPRLGVDSGITSGNIGSLLKHIDRQGLWGQEAAAFLIGVTKDATGHLATMVSPPQSFFCPYAPVTNVTFDVGKSSTVRKLGALLAEQKIPYEIDACLARSYDLLGEQVLVFHGSNFFKPDGKVKLERGLNCITFLDLALGTNLSNVSGKTGADIVSALSGTVLVNTNVSKIRSHFTGAKDTRSDCYVLWWDAHCTIVVDNIVCEYSRSQGGYRETPIMTYLKNFNTIQPSLAQIAVS
jgi:hypothetical protein